MRVNGNPSKAKAETSGRFAKWLRSSTCRTESPAISTRGGSPEVHTGIGGGVLPSCAKTLPAGYFENGTGRPEGTQRGAEYGGDGGCWDGAASIASDPVRRAVRAARPSTAARSSSPLRPPITRSFTFEDRKSTRLNSSHGSIAY